jgi:hypothetical protein
MRALTLWIVLMAAVLGQTYKLVGTVAAASGTLEVWNAEVNGKTVAVVKVKELSKPSEANVPIELSQVFDLQARCEQLLKDRTAMKPDSVHVVSTLKSGANSIDFALVRVGKGETLRILVAKSEGNERSFMLDNKNWPTLRKFLKKLTV